MKNDLWRLVYDYTDPIREELYLSLFDEKIYQHLVCEWQKVFNECLYAIGIKDKESANTLFEWGKEGHNWRKLHLNEDEENWSTRDTMIHFVSELEYCSDRMSLDRLFRCHWLYNTMVAKYKKQYLKGE